MLECCLSGQMKWLQPTKPCIKAKLQWHSRVGQCGRKKLEDENNHYLEAEAAYLEHQKIDQDNYLEELLCSFFWISIIQEFLKSSICTSIMTLVCFVRNIINHYFTNFSFHQMQFLGTIAKYGKHEAIATQLRWYKAHIIASILMCIEMIHLWFFPI